MKYIQDRIMKNTTTYLSLAIVAALHLNVSAQQNYDTDTFENYVADQEVQESLNNAQEILCQIANMGTEDLANDGAYKATQSLTLCSTSSGGSGSADGTAATATVSAQSSTTAAASTTSDATVTAVDIDEYTIDSQFIIDGSQVTKLWFNDDTPFDEQTNRQPKMLTYVKLQQTASPSTDSKFGTFTAKWQAFANGNRPEDFPEDSWVLQYECSEERIASGWSWCLDGTSLGEGTLIAQGNAVKYRARENGPEENLAAEFLPNGDVKGVYTRETGWQDESLIDPSCDGSDDWWQCQSQEFRDSSVNVTGQFTFGRQAETKLFCTTLAGLFELDWSEYPPLKTAVTLNEDVRTRLKERNWSVDEVCYSVDATTTTKNVWDYGVYDLDGAPYELANPSFPIKAIVDVVEDAGTEDEKTIKRRIHGYASYWGVHVDDQFQNLVTNTTEFKRDDLSSNALGADNIYNVNPRPYRIERTDKVYNALNDLDGLALQFYVGNDEWWSAEYESLGFPAGTTFNSRIAFASNKASLIDYDNGSSSDAFSHSIYGEHDGASTYNANLVGGKIDKTNLLKLLANESGDPGKVMNFNVKLGAIPGSDYSFQRDISPHMFLCTGSTIVNTANTFGPDQFTLAAGQACLMVTGSLRITGDGTTLDVTSKAGDSVYATYFDDSGLQLSIPNNYPFALNEIYNFTVTADGINQDQLYLDINFGTLIDKFAALSEVGNRAGDNNGLITESLEAFINSSDTFTFLAQSHGMNLYTHDGKRFDKIKGTFEIADSPPMAIYADDISVNETSGTADVTFQLTKNAATDTTVDYAIAATSTASADDYTLASTGTVTIPAGSSTATLSIAITDDAIAESLADETIVLTLSNATNATLGRTSTTVHIFDNDINRESFQEYIAVFNAETQTFTVEEAIRQYPYWELVTLDTPFAFTVTDWLTKMSKTYNEGTDWESTETRDIGAWSSDTETYYRIFPAAMQNPTSSAKGTAVMSEQRTQISAADLPDNLYCFERCPSTATIKSHYDDALSKVTDGGEINSPSPAPYTSAGPRILSELEVTRVFEAGTDNEYSEVQTYEAGHYFQGQILADMYTYTKSDGALQDQDSSDLAITSDFSAYTRPSEAIRGSHFVPEWGGRDGTEWGIWTGQMIDAEGLALAECDKDQDGTYREYNPRYTGDAASTTRYCMNVLWSENSPVETFYNVSIETNRNYELYNSDGSKVAFDRRQSFDLVLPDDTDLFGEDAGKKFRLDFNGGHLGGIPGTVINVDTGEDLGEWVREWSNNYRWVQRFVIPDGTQLQSRTSDLVVKVKALRGEEWLAKRDDAIGTMPTLLDYGFDKMAKREDLEFEIGPRPQYWWGCDSNENGISDERESDLEGWEWVQNPDGTWIEPEQIDICNDPETGEPTLFDADGNPIYFPYQPEYATEDQLRYYVLNNSFASCIEKNEYEIAQWTANNNQRNDDDPNKFGVYTQDEGFMSYFQRELDRCETIGPVPDEATLINNGLPAVVDGKVVFDPTP